MSQIVTPLSEGGDQMYPMRLPIGSFSYGPVRATIQTRNGLLNLFLKVRVILLAWSWLTGMKTSGRAATCALTRHLQARRGPRLSKLRCAVGSASVTTARFGGPFLPPFSTKKRQDIVCRDS